MASKKITDLIAELRSWLPNYDHGPTDYPTVLYRTLACAPGGEELEDMGYEPIGQLGWHELDQLGRVLTTIQDKRDVEDIATALLNEDKPRGRKPIVKLIEELRSWLPNYDHSEYPTVLFRFLASAPGGDELVDVGYEPIGNLGWQELDQLGRVLEAIQGKRDVEEIVAGLTREGEEEGVEEMREAPRGGRTSWEELYRIENNNGRGFAPDQDDVRAAFAAYIADGAEPVQRRSTADDIAVVFVDGEGWILIGGDARGKNAWAVRIKETDPRVEGNEVEEGMREAGVGYGRTVWRGKGRDGHEYTIHHNTSEGYVVRRHAKDGIGHAGLFSSLAAAKNSIGVTHSGRFAKEEEAAAGRAK